MMEPVVTALKDHYDGVVELIVADFGVPETRKLMEMEGFEVSYIPMFYFIDSQGKIISSEAGVFSFEEMVERIEPILRNTVQ